MLTVLAPRVVFAGDAGHIIQGVDEAASVGVTITFAVCDGEGDQKKKG